MSFTYIYSFCMCAYMHMPWQACRSQRTTLGMVLFFCPEGPRDQIQVSRLGSKHSQMRIFLVKLIFRVIIFSLVVPYLYCVVFQITLKDISLFTSQKGKRTQITPGNFVSSANIIRLSADFSP